MLSDESERHIRSQFGAVAEKVCIIRHGIPFVEFLQPRESPLRRQLSCDVVFLSAGHMRPSKGYEVALSALAMFKQSGAKFRYLILGTSQPQWDPEGLGPKQLKHLIHELDLESEVVWIPKYLALKDMLQYIQAADIGLVTYTESDQISSGILPMILGCGRLAVATKFEFAESLASSVDGLYLGEINNPTSLCETIHRAVAQLDSTCTRMRSNYDRTRTWLWEHSGRRYMEVFEGAARRNYGHALSNRV